MQLRRYLLLSRLPLLIVLIFLVIFLFVISCTYLSLSLSNMLICSTNMLICSMCRKEKYKNTLKSVFSNEGGMRNLVSSCYAIVTVSRSFKLLHFGETFSNYRILGV